MLYIVLYFILDIIGEANNDAVLRPVALLDIVIIMFGNMGFCFYLWFYSLGNIIIILCEIAISLALNIIIIIKL